MNRITEALGDVLENRPLLVFGTVLVIISAIGSLPLVDKTFTITEAPWRFIVLATGVLMISIDLFHQREGEKILPLDNVTGGINQPAGNVAVTPIIEARGSAKDVRKGHYL